MELSELKFPTMREELLSYIRGLSDVDYQYRAWVERPSSVHGYDELDYTIHFFYDDTGLAENPYAWVGLVLRSRDEANCIKSLVSAIDVVFDKYGVELSDQEYLDKEEWEDVVKNARAALKVFVLNEGQ